MSRPSRLLVVSNDLVGFQKHRDRSNFLSCLNTMYPEAQVEGEG